MRKILIVGSAAETNSLDLTQLADESWSITFVDSSEEALKCGQSERFHAIVCRSALSSIALTTLTRALRSMPEFNQTPVIALIREYGSQAVLQALEAGVADVLPDNSNLEVLRIKLEHQLKFVAMQDELSSLNHAEAVRKTISIYNHEFNNPLTIALGNLEFLRNEISEANAKARVERIWSAAVRMSEIIKKIRVVRDSFNAVK